MTQLPQPRRSTVQNGNRFPGVSSPSWFLSTNSKGLYGRRFAGRFALWSASRGARLYLATMLTQWQARGKGLRAARASQICRGANPNQGACHPEHDRHQAPSKSGAVRRSAFQDSGESPFGSLNLAPFMPALRVDLPLSPRLGTVSRKRHPMCGGTPPATPPAKTRPASNVCPLAKAARPNAFRQSLNCDDLQPPLRRPLNPRTPSLRRRLPDPPHARPAAHLRPALTTDHRSSNPFPQDTTEPARRKNDPI